MIAVVFASNYCDSFPRQVSEGNKKTSRDEKQEEEQEEKKEGREE